MLARQGLDALPLIVAVGIPTAALDGESLIDAARLVALVSTAVSASGKPWLGLELGAAAQVLSHGPLGLAAAASGTLQNLPSGGNAGKPRHASLRPINSRRIRSRF